MGPDQNIYLIIGDLNTHANKSIYTQIENRLNGPAPDGRGGILRISQNNYFNETTGICGINIH
jgi:hypothetical protein